jgi:hypothetical protein
VTKKQTCGTSIRGNAFSEWERQGGCYEQNPFRAPAADEPINMEAAGEKRNETTNTRNEYKERSKQKAALGGRRMSETTRLLMHMLTFDNSVNVPCFRNELKILHRTENGPRTRVLQAQRAKLSRLCNVNLIRVIRVKPFHELVQI